MENEAEVKFAEPVKTGLYDFQQYSKQVQQTAVLSIGRQRTGKGMMMESMYEHKYPV